MNIKLRAAVEVAGIILVLGALIAGIQAMLRAATAAYGADQVFNGIIFALMAAAAYVCVGLLYDLRVARLQYRAKLNEMAQK